MPDQPEATDYSTYLLIDKLLQLQQPLTPTAADELLFIVVHQAYELWFKLILFELERARDALVETRPQTAVPPLRRVIAVERLLLEQLSVLETMSPEGFLAFRDPLAPASGFQSVQFREIEVVSGLRERASRTDLGLGPEAAELLARRSAEVNLWEGLLAAGRGFGLDLPAGDDAVAKDRRVTALAGLYHAHESPELALLHQVCELALDHDEAIATWRFRHALMAAREIGTRPGTGGSLGVAYLRSTLEQRFVPELWEARNQL